MYNVNSPPHSRGPIVLYVGSLRLRHIPVANNNNNSNDDNNSSSGASAASAAAVLPLVEVKLQMIPPYTRHDAFERCSVSATTSEYVDITRLSGVRVCSQTHIRDAGDQRCDVEWNAIDTAAISKTATTSPPPAGAAGRGGGGGAESAFSKVAPPSSSRAPNRGTGATSSTAAAPPKPAYPTPSVVYRPTHTVNPFRFAGIASPAPGCSNTNNSASSPLHFHTTSASQPPMPSTALRFSTSDPQSSSPAHRHGSVTSFTLFDGTPNPMNSTVGDDAATATSGDEPSLVVELVLLDSTCSDPTLAQRLGYARHVVHNVITGFQDDSTGAYAGCETYEVPVTLNPEIFSSSVTASSPSASSSLTPPRSDCVMAFDLCWKELYCHLRTIGTGGFGVVDLCENTRTNQRLAIKTIMWRHVASEHIRTVREVDIMQQLSGRHPCVMEIVDTFGTFTSARESNSNSSQINVHFVMPLLKGDLYRFLRDRAPPYQQTQGFSATSDAHAATCLILAYQTAFGLDYMHKCGIVHRDLKTENILVTIDLASPARSRAVVGDFGLARNVSSEPHTIYVCTRSYRAPEVITLKHAQLPPEVQPALDVWSLGCILYEIVTGRTLFSLPSSINEHGQWEGYLASKQLEVILNIVGVPPHDDIKQYMVQEDNVKLYLMRSDARPSILRNLLLGHFKLKSSDWERDLWIDLIVNCVRFFPQQRLTAAEVCTHSLFRYYGIAAQDGSFVQHPPVYYDPVKVSKLPHENKLSIAKLCDQFPSRRREILDRIDIETEMDAAIDRLKVEAERLKQLAAAAAVGGGVHTSSNSYLLAEDETVQADIFPIQASGSVYADAGSGDSGQQQQPQQPLQQQQHSPTMSFSIGAPAARTISYTLSPSTLHNQQQQKQQQQQDGGSPLSIGGGNFFSTASLPTPSPHALPFCQDIVEYFSQLDKGNPSQQDLQGAMREVLGALDNINQSLRECQVQGQSSSINNNSSRGAASATTAASSADPQTFTKHSQWSNTTDNSASSRTEGVPPQGGGEGEFGGRMDLEDEGEDEEGYQRSSSSPEYDPTAFYGYDFDTQPNNVQSQQQQQGSQISGGSSSTLPTSSQEEAFVFRQTVRREFLLQMLNYFVNLQSMPILQQES